MDSNKLKVLQEVGYRINRCCGLCKYGWFPKTDWGTCEVWKYEHEKHSDASRQLSIHKLGVCSKFELKTMTSLGPWIEFLDGPR
jgi:hypothetical protein